MAHGGEKGLLHPVKSAPCPLPSIYPLGMLLERQARKDPRSQTRLLAAAITEMVQSSEVARLRSQGSRSRFTGGLRACGPPDGLRAQITVKDRAVRASVSGTLLICHRQQGRGSSIFRSFSELQQEEQGGETWGVQRRRSHGEKTSGIR